MRYSFLLFHITADKFDRDIDLWKESLDSNQRGETKKRTKTIVSSSSKNNYGRETLMKDLKY